MLHEHDHRVLGQRLDLFHLQEEAPGMVFWHPLGLSLFRLLQERVRHQLEREDYLEVATPQLLDQTIWEGSGHWQNFQADMFVLGDGARPAALKPVSCPGHVQLYGRMSPSYRDLPVRLSEFGLCHRNESSGALQGLFRLRQFTQDDGHIFCREDQLRDEVARFCASLEDFYRSFGFAQMGVALSTRPPRRGGADEVWDRAEAALQEAARSAGLEFEVLEGQGAFYGPKLEFSLRDRMGRSWQCGTIQLDFVLPERFDLGYVDRTGERLRPVMLHRALFGSVERFLGILLEHHEGVLPPWLAPVQVLVAPVGESAGGYAREVLERLRAAGLRGKLEGRAESLSRRIAEAHHQGIPFVLVLGGKEAEGRSVSVRERSGGTQWAASLGEGVARLVTACQPPPL